MTLPAAKPEWYGRVFESVRTAWDEHDKTCESLGDLWLGRKGGVSCPSDITACGRCEVLFYNEGVTLVNRDDPDAEEDIYLCECCRRRWRPAGEAVEP